MTDSGRASSGPPGKRRWGRRIVVILAIIFIPLIVGYFVATSDPFIKKVLLPQVGKALNAQITVADTSIHPFSSAVLRGVKVQTTGSEPLATIQEARVRYSLGSIIGGNIKVSEMALISPVVQIIKNPDGTSNLDPLMKKAKPEKPSKPEKKEKKPPQVDVGRVQIENAVLRMVQLHANGKRDVREISDFNLTAANIKNGATGSAEIAGKLLIDNNPPAPATNGLLAGTLDGKLSFALSKALEPESMKGGMQAMFHKGSGAMAELGGLGANIDCDVTLEEVKQLALKFHKGNTGLGEVRAYGPLSLAKQEGRLNVEVLSIDRQVLNLAGAGSGIDFGPTKINSTNQIELTKKGKMISAAGALNVNQFTITRTNQSTPPMDLKLAYDVAVNQPQQNALVRAFTLTGTQNQKALLSSQLTSPMNVSWGGTTQNIPDSALKVMITDLSFADWKAFLGDIAPAGKLNGTLNLASQQSGKRLTFDFNSQAEGVTAKLGTNTLQQVAMQILAKGGVSDLKLCSIDNYRAEITQAGKPMAVVSGAGKYDQASQQADLNATLEAHLAALANAMPNPKIKVSSGTLLAKLQVAQKQQTQSVTGNVVMEQLNATLETNAIQGFAANIELDLQKKGSQIEIRKATGVLRQGSNAGGNFDAKGSFDSERKTGQIDLKLADLNQTVLRPFLEPALKGKQLVSVSINANASAKLNGENDSAVQGNLEIAKFVVNDPAKRVPATPLNVKFQLDAAMAKQHLDLRQASVALSPTQRAKNEAQLKGQIDLSQPKAIQGKLNLFADSLDLTPYYDLVTADKQKKKPEEDDEAPEPAPAGPQPDPGAEPPAKKLPFGNFTADLKVNNLYLREVHVSNWVATAKVEGSRVALDPMELALNGRPVAGKVHLDLGVPGYRYEVALKADGIPIPPIANSFMPEYRAKQGNVFANINISGAGTKGVSLQKSLTGELTLNCTNAQIEVLPKFLRRTVKTVADWFKLPELRTAPMTGFAGNIQLGSGKIDIQKLDVATTAFMAHVEGAIPIAKVLTNSPLPKIPITLALKRSVAEKAGMLPEGTPADADFVQLPTFVRLTGTIAQPKPDLDQVVIAAIAAKRYVLPKIGGDAGKILQRGLGNILGEKKPASNANTNSPPSTNQPAGSAPGIFDLFKGPKEKK